MEDYKQKYDDALKRAKNYSEGHTLDVNPQAAMEYVFPELAQSEDEDIRRELIEYLKQRSKSGFNQEVKICNKGIAWLEKQSEIDKESYEIAEREKREFVDDGFIKCYADFQDFKEGETYWLEYLGNDNYNVRSDNLLGKTYHITPCQLYTIFKKQTWLEKQGKILESIKHKEAMLDCQTCANYKNECFPDRNIFKCSYPIKYSGEKHQDVEDVDEEQGGQNLLTKLRSSEPKFHKDDWVVFKLTGSVYQIKNCVENLSRHKYGYDLTNGGYIGIDEVNYYHLWTIKDAKKGDILQANNCTLIFDSLTKDIDGNTVISSWYHCDTETFYGMGTSQPDLWVIEGVVPATKEQHHIFFQKMKEAGYYWDNENKELKKIDWNDLIKYNPNAPSIIEENSAWTEEDESNLQGIIDEIKANKNSAPDYDLVTYDKFLSWLKSLKYRIQPKQEWSEEDKQMFKSLTTLLNDASCYSCTEGVDKILSWVKSLKNIVQPQPKEDIDKSDWVDLGLPSGTFWKSSNETNPNDENDFYTFNDALQKFGSQLPTKEQWDELKENCEWTWEGTGYKITGWNGYSIFLPAAGRNCNGNVNGVGFFGHYWSSALKYETVRVLNFNSTEVFIGFCYRGFCLSVRLAKIEKSEKTEQ